MNDSLQNALDWISGTPLRVAIILISAMIAQAFGTRAIERAMNRLATADLVPGPRNIVSRQKERARTIGGVLSSTLKTVIWVVAAAMALGEFGFNLGPLIASSGIFMLVEDQYGVGDQVDVLDVQGVVEKVGLRVTSVRDKKGTLWYLRNGEILKVGNQSQSG